MRTSTITLAILFTVGPLSAQPNPAAQSEAAEAPKTAEVHGTVLSSSGEPITNATIRLQNITRPASGPRAYSTSTDATGNFSFQDVTPGSYTLAAERPGYVRQVLGQHGMSALGALLNLRAGERREQISIVLQSHAVISGTVTNADGDRCGRIRFPFGFRPERQRSAHDHGPGPSARCNG